jgi:nucleotide sugar dehydrogenase
MIKIGIVGNGFVGNAVLKGFSNYANDKYQIKVFDKDTSKSFNSLDETINDSDYIFLSVPTPAKKSGEIDLSILNKSLKEINNISRNKNIILIRSTIVPGTTRALQNKYPKLNFVFNPEFLTERNAVDDFSNLNRIILGGELLHTSKVEEFYRTRFGNKVEILKTNFQTAELIKYMNNLFLATKVSFLNEMKLLAKKVDVDWNKAIQGFKLDDRMGNSHDSIPGHDGKLGFGGSCLPKDIQALINFAKCYNLDMHVLQGAWKTNLLVRPDKDWKKLKGRAVSE